MQHCMTHDTSGSSAALEVEQLMITLGAYRTAVQSGDDFERINLKGN